MKGHTHCECVLPLTLGGTKAREQRDALAEALLELLATHAADRSYPPGTRFFDALKQAQEALEKAGRR